jgi:hypothetical protein
MKTERQLANERHMKMVAKNLNGREYGHELDDHEAEQLESVGLVVAFGYSDDNVEFRGAFNEEVGGYEDFEIPFLDGNILTKCHEECNEHVCPLWKDAISRTKTSRATFGNDGCKFDADIPHEKFTIMEDGEVYGEGIVFAYEDVRGKVKW